MGINLPTTSNTPYIDLGEWGSPANPAANEGRIYVADATGTTTLYFRDSSGTVTNITTSGGASEIDDLSDASTAGTASVFLGSSSGSGEPNYGTGVGYEALSVGTGVNNTAIGYQSLVTNSTGTNNTAVGYQSGSVILSGIYNIALGSNALNDGTTTSTFDHNIAMGSSSMGSTYEKSGSHNIAMGYYSLRGITSGSYNIGLGYNAGAVMDEGSYNIILGYSGVDGGSVTAAFDANICIGRDVMGSFSSAKSGNDNIAIGQESLYYLTSGSTNIAIGYESLNSLTEGIDNVGVGSGVLHSVTSGNKNVGIGFASGAAITTGDSNSCLGHDSANALTTGDFNVCLGHSAGAQITTTDYNIAIGSEALGDAGTGSFVGVDCIAIGRRAMALGVKSSGFDGNIAIGSYALEDFAAGYTSTVAIGYEAAKNLTAGSTNILIGYQAAIDMTVAASMTGVGHQVFQDADTYTIDVTPYPPQFSVAVGYGAGYNSSGVKWSTQSCIFIGSGSGSTNSVNTKRANSIVIGTNLLATADNTVYLGNEDTDYYIMASGTSWAATSDRNLKREIEDSILGLDFIMNLRPVTYKFKNKDGTNGRFERNHYGFIAQEVKEIIDSTNIDFAGYVDPKVNTPECTDPLSLRYEEFISPAIKAIQEQQLQIEDLKKELKDLKEKLK